MKINQGMPSLPGLYVVWGIGGTNPGILYIRDDDTFVTLSSEADTRPLRDWESAWFHVKVNSTKKARKMLIEHPVLPSEYRI